MKAIVLTISFIITLSLTLSGFILIGDSNPKHKLIYPSPLDMTKIKCTDNNTLRKDADLQNSDWYSQAMENMKEREYEISYSEELKAYQSPNRNNNIRFIYHNDGFTAKTRDSRIPLFDLNDKSIKEEDKKFKIIPEWSIEFRLSNVKRQMSNEESGNMNYELGLFKNSEINVSGNKAFIEDENMRIEYTNNKEGMRQDFIIKKRPEGEGKLRLNISADTKLKMIVGADALMFKDKKGEDMMKYSALKCWDANGKELRAFFEKNYELGIRNCELNGKTIFKNKGSKIKSIPNSKFLIPNSFSIVVNDEDAVYPITIDPLSESPDWTKEGNQSFAQFGYSVATAGDVNGDGYSDVIVGAPYYDNGQTDEGRVYVMHGSSSGLSATANWTFDNDTAGSLCGTSVSTAGDVNNDGYSDILIGAPQWNNTGKVYVFHGSSSGLSAADIWQKQINQSDAGFGISVSTAGDINGDGYSDVIIGAPYANDGESDEGRANIYLGSSTGLSNTIHKRLEINSVNANFGYSVSLAGDVNGDGYSDVIIGAPKLTSGQTEEGKAYIHLGTSAGIDTNEYWSSECNQSNAAFGNSVSGAGDVNGDGLSDVIVGAPEYDNNFTNSGRVFVYYGHSSSMSSTAVWTKEQELFFPSIYFGCSVSTAGDVNGDGYGDIIVGSFGYTNVNGIGGRAHAYFGSSSGLPNSYDWSQEGGQDYAFFGWSVATAGDVNGDGFSDVIVGAPLYDNPQTNEGRTLLYNGYADGLHETENWSIAGLVNNVSSAGDVNGDGYNDVIFGGSYYHPSGNNYGEVYVFHGSASGLSQSANWQAGESSDWLGCSFSTAGDVNGDGYADVIVGLPAFDNGQTIKGRAYVYHGSATGLSATANWTVESNQASATFGGSVCTAGDVNGDGYSDVIVGSPDFGNGQTDEGIAFVYHGSASGLSATANWTAESNQEFAEFGNSVSTAGDVNGDGYSDVIVGAPEFDNGHTNEGRTFVYHGSATGLSPTANWTAESNQAFADFGRSVSAAGDVNGDGYSDVIVGVPEFDNGQTYEGRAYVYHGSATGLSATANWTAESNEAYANFGYSVSIAGDVNGDGYSDVIVGALYYNNGQTNEGRTFVYHGSASGLTATANWTAEGNEEDAYFGAVSTAGDVNGDGYSDVIVGAGGIDKAFVFYGNSGTGLRSTVRQYKPGTNEIIYAGGFSGTFGQAKFGIFGRSPFGRADGKIIYEYKDNGVPFSGTTITNSTSSSGSGISTDLGTSGFNLRKDVSGLLTNKEYKWRARVEYDLANNPFQKLGPWKYYSNYIPTPFGGFKAIIVDTTSPIISYNDLQDTNSLSNFVLSLVEITDVNGVQGSPGTRPRIYFKRVSDTNTFNDNTSLTGGWKYAEATGSTSPFSFNVYYSLLNGNISYGDTIQYFVVAQDNPSFGSFHVGINSGTFAAVPASVKLSSSTFPIGGSIKTFKLVQKILNFSMLIQGFYYPAVNAMVQDTATVYLRNSSSPFAAVDSTKGYLSPVGAGTFVFNNAANGVNYFIQLKHRNSIETWSKTPQMFTGNSLSYDFITSAAQAFGDNMKQVDFTPVRFAIYSGDVNQDGVIDLNDVLLTYNAANVFASGYVVTDINGDNNVDLNDILIAYNNSAAFVAVIKP